MLVEIPTTKTVADAAAALHTAAAAHHFGVMHVHNLGETMAKKGVAFAHECVILEVCQPQQAKQLLEHDMSIATALPCRIAIYEKAGKTMLATMKPTAVLATFAAPPLAGVAEEVEATIIQIMQQAATG